MYNKKNMNKRGSKHTDRRAMRRQKVAEMNFYENAGFEKIEVEETEFDVTLSEVMNPRKGYRKNYNR